MTKEIKLGMEISQVKDFSCDTAIQAIDTSISRGAVTLGGKQKGGGALLSPVAPLLTSLQFMEMSRHF